MDTNIHESTGILTVGQLRQLLEGLDADTHVVIANNDDGWYTNISEVVTPDEECPTVIFFGGEAFDTRQI